MALNIGELVGYLDLDAGPFEKGLGKAFDSMGSKKWQVAGAAAGVAAGTAILGGIMSSMETEKLNNKMAASLGLTKDQSATAGKAAGQLYADNYGSSMEDVTGAVEGVMSSISGMRTSSQADIQAVTKDVLNLGSAFELDVGQTSQIVGQMITSGIATDAKNAADLLAGTLSKVPKNVREDIMDAVDEYSPFMATLGIKGEEAMGILATSSEKGMYGIDKTGDALKEFTIRSTDMSKATGGAYKTLGMNQEKMTARLLAGGPSAKKAFGEIVAGLQGMKDPVEQSQAALALFGTPLEDLSVTEIPKFLGSIDPMGDKFDSLKGKAAELDSTLGAGASNGWTKFQRGAETAMSAIGAQVLPILTPIIEKMTEWAPILGPLVLALGAFAAIMWVVNAAMAANPITWIILGIMLLIAAVVLLVMNWSTVVQFITGIWGGFIGWLTGGLAKLGGQWSSFWAGVFAFLGSKITEGKNFAVSVFTTMIAWITGVPGRVLSGLSGLAALAGKFLSWVGGAKDAAVGKFLEMVSWAAGLPGRILGALGDLGGLLLGAGGQIIAGFLKGLQQGFEDVKNFVGGIGDWIAKNKGPKAYDLALLIPAGGWIMDGLGKGIEKSMPGLKKVLGSVSATIENGVTGGAVGLAGIPSGTLGGSAGASASGPASVTNNWHLYEQSDPAATAMDVARRQRRGAV